MSIFSRGEKVDAVLFSPMEGRLTFHGEPAKGAEIKLWIKWKDQTGETITFAADERGFFSIPKKIDRFRDDPLAQVVITQEITVYYNNKDYLIWTLSKTSLNEYSELGGKPVNLICEITDEMEPRRTDESLMATNCKWDSLIKNGE